MKLSSCLFASLLILTSCQNKIENAATKEEVVPEVKLYAVTIVSEGKNMFGQTEVEHSEPDVIEATDDSIAFCKAVEKYYIAVYAVKLTENNANKSNIAYYGKYPKSFILHTSEGKDLSNGFFLSNPTKIMEETEKMVKDITAKNME